MSNFNVGEKVFTSTHFTNICEYTIKNISYDDMNQEYLDLISEDGSVQFIELSDFCTKKKSEILEWYLRKNTRKFETLTKQLSNLNEERLEILKIINEYKINE